MNKPLTDYPRPQFRRDSFLSLNGEWEYRYRQDDEYQPIIVPFSMESEFNGAKHTLEPGELLEYRYRFTLPNNFKKDLVYLHFLGVDQIADVYLNSCHLGQHIGGFLPFKFEISKYLKEGENTLEVKVKDDTDTSYHSRGKQKLKHGGIFYQPQSGIYFPVFMESVPFEHVEKIKLTPNIDNKKLVINVTSLAKECYVSIEGNTFNIYTNKDIDICIKNPHLWTTDDPYLYPLKVRVGEDEITSYFAMRKFSIVTDDKGIKRFALNNKPIFMHGVLDQGYYKKGLLTPESYDDYIKDIDLAKSLGFNTIRKHIKIEIPRWYYECDKRGMIVWQDFVNGGGKFSLFTHTLPLFTHHHSNDHNYKKFFRTQENGRIEARNEFKETIDYLYNSPCIALWTIFNEGWGQFDAKEILEELEKIDNTRLFDHASGWHDQYTGDIKSMHVYFQKVKLPKNDKRCMVVSEYGGLVHPIEGHVIKGNSVYKKYLDKEDYMRAYEEMIKRDIILNIEKGLSAAIYTQLSDVEEETNGFVTYDREVIKVDVPRIKNINSKVKLD